MQVIGCLMWWAFGALCILAAKKIYGKKEVNYEQYPTIDAVVIGTHDYHGTKWMVKFKDEAGREVIGADDTFAESTFHPQKYSLPKRGTTERVYYWKTNHRGNHTINDAPILYTIHFCNEDFYILRKEKVNRWRKVFRIVGILMFLAGAAILVSGHP